MGESYAPLFVVERNVNKNKVHYDARLTADGRLDPVQPVVAYWTMDAEDGRRQNLNLLERSRAYGFSTQASGEGCRMVLAADHTRAILISKRSGVVRAETSIGGRRAYLRRVFVNTHRSMMLNVPDSAEMYGDDVETGEPRYERVGAH